MPFADISNVVGAFKLQTSTLPTTVTFKSCLPVIITNKSVMEQHGVLNS